MQSHVLAGALAYFIPILSLYLLRRRWRSSWTRGPSRNEILWTAGTALVFLLTNPGRLELNAKISQEKSIIRKIISRWDSSIEVYSYGWCSIGKYDDKTYVGMLSHWILVSDVQNVSPTFKSFMIALQVIIFFAWQFQGYSSETMADHFTSSWHNMRRGRAWTLATGSISHASVLHFVLNLSSLSQLIPQLEETDLHLPTFWFASAVGAALASIIWHGIFRRQAVDLLGASGVVYAMQVAIAVRSPSARFIAYGREMSAFQLLQLRLGIDMAMYLMQGASLHGIDVPCHVGGAVCGYMLSACSTGKQWLGAIYRRRSPRQRWWSPVHNAAHSQTPIPTSLHTFLHDVAQDPTAGCTADVTFGIAVAALVIFAWIFLPRNPVDSYG